MQHTFQFLQRSYCSEEIRNHDRSTKPRTATSSIKPRTATSSLGHVPLIDHNSRGGEKIAFDPAETLRYKERSQAEHSNARLKDELGGRQVWVRGPAKVMNHLMFGLLALTADQLLRLFR